MLSKGSEKAKEGEGKEGLGTTLVLGAALLAGGLGVYMAIRKPPAIYPGDKITVSYLTLKYRGVEADLFLCWGLKNGDGDFNNGDNLVGGLWTWGGPIHVDEAPDWKEYRLNPQEELEKKPILFLDPDIVEPRSYQTYVWMTKDEPFMDRDKEFLEIYVGPWIKVKSP